MSVEKLPEHLLLGQDDTPLGSRAVYRDDKYNTVALIYEIGDYLFFFFAVLDYGRKAQSEPVEPLSRDRAHIYRICAVGGDIGQQVGLVHHGETGKTAAFYLAEQGVVLAAEPDSRVDYQHSYVCLAKHLAGALDPQLAKSALVVEARGVDEHDRPEREELHSLADRIGGGARGV